MKKIERMAEKEFLKLSKKEQRRINNLRRVPTAAPGYEFGHQVRPRQKRWNEEEV